MNPTIDIIFEEIDFSSSSSEYFDIFDENNNLISRCSANQDVNCLVWETCLDNEYLPISRISANHTFQMEIEGSSSLHVLCSSYHSYSLNIKMTITCGGG